MNTKSFLIPLVLLAVGCGGEEFESTALKAGTGGVAGAGTGGQAGQETGGSGGTGSIATGGQAGSAGSAGEAGSAGGGGVSGSGATGGTGGSGATGGGTGSTGGTGATGGTGSTGGTGATGGQGGSGGGTCTEWTSQEIAALCAGKCGYPSKCQEGVFGSCAGQPAACALPGPYDVCDWDKTWESSPEPTFDCLVHARTGAADQCSFNSGYPFEYGPKATDVNGISDNEETGIDCGGPNNPVKCKGGPGSTGGFCLLPSDCETGSPCVGANPLAGTYGHCGIQSGSAPKEGCSLSGSSVCCAASSAGWHPADDVGKSACVANGWAFSFQKDGPQGTGPMAGCSKIGTAWCCPSDQFL